VSLYAPALSSIIEESSEKAYPHPVVFVLDFVLTFVFVVFVFFSGVFTVFTAKYFSEYVSHSSYFKSFCPSGITRVTPFTIGSLSQRRFC
jgi:hypothetical protein